MVVEILTWVGVGIAALVAFMLYRSAERDNRMGQIEPEEAAADD